jgi:hypothetical protein|tara:strand:+ start:11038 stop:11424 length:387 start_codon:yes stop_codon:yes gene_type:complete
VKKDWKYELARDSMAFGSILFYIIVIARAIIGDYMIFVYQLLIAIAILILSSLIIKNTNHYIARTFVLVVFTSLFYKDALFTIFAVLLWLFMIGSAFYMKENKKSIFKGIILGIIAALVGYYLSLLIG